jgi:hypothetical protein
MATTSTTTSRSNRKLSVTSNRLADRQSRQPEQYQKHGDEDGDSYDCELGFIAHCRPVPVSSIMRQEETH